MELSDEQKKRILEEEHQRLAEEQYRAQVRQQLQTPTVATPPTSPVVEPPKAPKRDGVKIISAALFVIVGSLALIGIAIAIFHGIAQSLIKNSQPYAPSVIATKHTEKIGTSQFVVAAGKVLYYRIPINDVRDIRITGHFLALGGQGNDINVVLADEPNFGLWMDRQPAKVYYQSGRATSGDIDVKLSPITATYYLCFDNRFSLLSAKTINADISLFYSTVALK
jgi:hypothetical protein